MKTLQQVKDRMAEILATDKKHLKPSAIKRLQNEYDYLNTISAYLDSNPRVEFIEKEKNRLIDLINKIDVNYRNWLSASQSQVGLEGKSRSQLKSYYNKINNVSKLNLQLKTAYYLLE